MPTPPTASTKGMIPQIDGYVRKHKHWQNELQELRRIVLNSGLTEEVKWRVPCYTAPGDRNIVFLGAFKESCVLSFVKGVLLKDAKKILVPPGPSSQSVRVIRFTNVKEILAIESTLKAYIKEAIAVEKTGVKVTLKENPEPIPEELQKKLDEMPALKKAFNALTRGRQRSYILDVSGAKQSKTREARVEKNVQRILEGKGMMDD